MCCRESHSRFIVPHREYLKGTASRAPEGTGLETKHDLDDPPERRSNEVNLKQHYIMFLLDASLSEQVCILAAAGLAE